MNVSAEMPRYKCHKQVWALKIKLVELPEEKDDDLAWLHFVEETYAPITVPIEIFARYKPQPGDYYVVYDDGYKSFSPAKAFEEGYTRL